MAEQEYMSERIVLIRQNLSEQAKEAVKRSLIIGAYKPGERLLLRRVADELGISVTPVREALLQLVAEQALVMGENRTIVVPTMSVEYFDEITEIRIDLETKAAKYATKLISESTIEELERLHATVIESKKVGDYTSTRVANENFHFTLYRASGKHVLCRLIEALWVQAGPLINRLYDPPLPITGRHDHFDIIEGLRKRDAAMVTKGLRNDLLMNAKIVRERIANVGAQDNG